MEMVSPGNLHCANCIGTLSFPIRYVPVTLTRVITLTSYLSASLPLRTNLPIPSVQILAFLQCKSYRQTTR